MAKKQPPPPPESPGARAPAPPIWLRVRAIRLHLEAGTWSGEVERELAEEWGLDPAIVRRHAAEASRQLEAVLDAGAAARQIEADLSAAIQTAFAQGDMGAVQRLLETRLKLHGIGAHRDPKNDPKPTAAAVPTPPEEVPFWLKKKGPKEASS